MERLHLSVDELELRVVIGLVRAFTGFAVGLQAEPKRRSSHPTSFWLAVKPRSAKGQSLVLAHP